MLRRLRVIEIVPGSKPFRWRRHDVPQHLAPETSDALRFCAVEGDLDLLDRRHRSTIGEGSFIVSTGRRNDSRARQIRAGWRGVQLRDAVAADVRHAAELLETGLASLSRGTQAGGR